MTAIETLLAGLFDYAGLYPPASVGLRAAANNYLEYSRSEHASALGRFIIGPDRIEELRSIVGDSLEEFKLSVIAGEDADWASLAAQVRAGPRIESLEVKCTDPHVIERTVKDLPPGVEVYFEVPLASEVNHVLETIRDVGARAKLRMGGVVREAIPPATDVLQMLRILSDFRLPFKATAGLHHPLRSTQSLTYQPQSPTGVMHGFVNLFAAAMLLYFDGTVDEAEQLLAEEDATAWRISANSMHWRDRSWMRDQIATVRHNFFISIGSCSFEEPVHDLESLGWL